MITSSSRRLARLALKSAGEHLSVEEGSASAVVGVGYALLELAYQVGRLADQSPVYGPPEEQ
jgi:hypothetical protein